MKPVTLAPADMATIRTTIANGGTAAEIGATFGVTRKTLLALVKRHNLGPWRSRGGNENGRQQRRPIPDDFAILALTMRDAALTKHYRCGGQCPGRWRQELGLPTPPRLKSGPKPKFIKPVVVKAPARPAHLVRNAYQTTPVDRTQRDMSIVGQAADHLRRFGPVWRCNERGGPDVAGKRWRRGNAILTDAELIERAAYNGFDADAWKRVA